MRITDWECCPFRQVGLQELQICSTACEQTVKNITKAGWLVHTELCGHD